MHFLFQFILIDLDVAYIYQSSVILSIYFWIFRYIFISLLCSTNRASLRCRVTSDPLASRGRPCELPEYEFIECLLFPNLFYLPPITRSLPGLLTQFILDFINDPSFSIFIIKYGTVQRLISGWSRWFLWECRLAPSDVLQTGVTPAVRHCDNSTLILSWMECTRVLTRLTRSNVQNL